MRGFFNFFAEPLFFDLDLSRSYFDNGKIMVSIPGKRGVYHMVNDDQVWKNFADEYDLSAEQLELFKRYYQLLVEWSERFNLTTITGLQEVVNYHFKDSLMVGSFLDLSTCSMLADIGTGAGLPGIPLKIKYPSLSVVLVEVTLKKVRFLEHVIENLGLMNIQVCPIDWRTFLRTTKYPVDVVCARASLRPDELIRMFSEASPYKDARLIYWASDTWKLGEKEQNFFVKHESYTVGEKARKYVFFTASGDI